MSFLNMFGGAPKNNNINTEESKIEAEEIVNDQEGEGPSRLEVSEGRVLTPGDQEDQKKQNAIPEGWRDRE